MKILLGIFLFCFMLSSGYVVEGREFFKNDGTQKKYVLILTGISANSVKHQQFQKWSAALYDLMIDEYAYPQQQVLLLMEPRETETRKIWGEANKTQIQKAFEWVHSSIEVGDQLSIVMIGHGTSDESGGKFNIRGPDIHGNEMAELLKTFPDQDIVLINTTGNSHPFCLPLSAPGRVILCATRSAIERYDTHFPEFFLEALSNHQGDRDKNRRVSLWEAFFYAQTKVQAWFVDNDRLPTEHPTLDDNGDGQFSTTPDPGLGDGGLSQIAYLNHGLSEKGSVSPAKRQLENETLALEREIVLWKHQKPDLAPDKYMERLESLLVKLALASRKLRGMK